MKLPFNMQELMAQAQKMQSDISNMQSELSSKTVQASSGGGMVNVEMNGALQLNSIQIEKAAVDPNDVEMLQDLIQAAVNEGLRKAKDLAQEEMKKLTGGLPIPGFGS